MTINVDGITILVNMFSKSGRQANKQIKTLRKEHPICTIYQRRLKDNKIALLATSSLDRTKTSRFMVVDEEKILGNNRTHLSYLCKDFDLLHKVYESTKTRFGEFKNTLKTVEKAVLYRMPGNKIEESATKTILTDGPVELRVYSPSDRKTPFYMTKLAGTLHPAMAQKKTLPNGDIIYIERHTGK